MLGQAIGSSNDVSGTTFFPTEPKCAGCVMNIEVTFTLNDLKYGGSFTAIRIEGTKNSTNERVKNLMSKLKIIDHDVSILATHQSEIFWNKVKNLEVFSSTKNNVIRIIIPPSQCVQLLYQLASSKFKYYLDWDRNFF